MLSTDKAAFTFSVYTQLYYFTCWLKRLLILKLQVLFIFRSECQYWKVLKLKFFESNIF